LEHENVRIINVKLNVSANSHDEANHFIMGFVFLKNPPTKPVR